MEVLSTFFLAFFFSFIGSVPPGTLNLTMIQLGLEHKMEVAFRFALAAAIIEYPYGWLAIEFESLITSNPLITRHFQLITGVVMILVGAFNLWVALKPTRIGQKFQGSGFRRGIVLSILNPMALPYWIGITAYLRSLSWVSLTSQPEVHAYLFGVSTGALALLLLFAYIARKLVSHLQEFSLLKKIPGLLMIALGAFAIADYLRMNFSIS